MLQNVWIHELPYNNETLNGVAKNGAVNGAVNDREKEVLEKIIENPYLTRKELSLLTNKGTTTIYRFLKVLQEKGIIERVVL